MTILTTNDLVTILSKAAHREGALLLASGLPKSDEFDYEVSRVGEDIDMLRGQGDTPEKAVEALFDLFLEQGVMLHEDFVFPPKRVSVYRVGEHVSDFTSPLLKQFVSTKYLRIPLPEGSEGIPANDDILPEFAIAYQGSRSSAVRVLDTLKVALGLAS